MFCLFRYSRIIAPYHFWVNVISIAPVIYWLYFALVEKAFLDNFLSGQTLFVDLLLGLPVVLIFAIVIYAMVFWLLKLTIVLLVPSWIIKLEPLQETENDELDEVFDPSVDDIGEKPYQGKTETNSNDSSKALSKHSKDPD